MKGLVLVLLAALVITACDSSTPGGDSASSNSPIASFDKDRLWILIKGGRLGDGKECADFYRAPDDVRYKGLANRCEAWTLNFADYLKLNGLPDVEAGHLRELTYWDWFEAMKQLGIDCRADIGYLTGKTNGDERKAHQTARNNCDPWSDATKNNKQTPTDLGIRYK